MMSKGLRYLERILEATGVCGGFGECDRIGVSG